MSTSSKQVSWHRFASKGKSTAKHVAFFILAYMLLSTVVNLVRAPKLDNLTDLTKLSGVSVTGRSVVLHEQLAHKPVLVYFWGSWCPACRTTTGTAANLSKQSSIAVISVAVDSGNDADVIAFLNKKDHGALAKYTLNDSNGALMRQWRVHATPTFVLLNQHKGSIKAQALTGFRSELELKIRLWIMRRT